MELNNNSDDRVILKFRVISNESKYLEEVINWYNNTYGTDFKILEVIYDEVNFADVEVSRYKSSDLFALGYQLGVMEQRLREKGEIDW